MRGTNVPVPEISWVILFQLKHDSKLAADEFVGIYAGPIKNG